MQGLQHQELGALLPDEAPGSPLPRLRLTRRPAQPLDPAHRRRERQRSQPGTELAAVGARLALVRRRTEPLEEVAALVREAGAQAHVASADLTERGGAEAVAAAALEVFGGLDVLVNNARKRPRRATGGHRGGRGARADRAEPVAPRSCSPPAALPALKASGDGLGRLLTGVEDAEAGA